MGVGLLAGALLARLKLFHQHAWCQSVIMLVNLLLIVVTMLPSFRVHVAPRIPLKLGKAYYALATAHAVLGNLGGRRRFVHPAGCRHEPVAGAITHQELQAVDAHCVSAVVGCTFVGHGDLRPLVHSSFVPEITHEHRSIQVLLIATPSVK